ncbi:hypothetical protein L9F63_001204, partial [Diploptera punctata]
AEEFFNKIEGMELPFRTQDKIAETLVKWLPDVKSNWTFPRFRMIEKVGDPLIAHMPPSFVANLTDSEAIRLLYHFRNWLWSNIPENVWEGKLDSARRVWADTMFRTSYPVNIKKWTQEEGRKFRYLLEGATPDELKLLTSEQLQDSKLFKANLSKLQIRALFSVMYPHSNLTSANLSDVLLPVALQLTPENLQKFNITTTDFEVLSASSLEGCSFSTALQVLESLIAQSVFSRKLKNEKIESWGNGIEHVGKFVYVLPPSALESYRSHTLSLLVQSSIDSDRLSARQKLDPQKERKLEIQQMRFLRSLVGITRRDHFANETIRRGLQVYNIVKYYLQGKSWALKNILLNKNPNQYFELLDSQTVTMLESDIKEMKGFDSKIKSLPQNTLSALLTSQRTKLTTQNVLWSSESLLSEDNILLLLGLSCNDIYAMETVDFINILETYNKQRKLFSKAFPKDLQFCTQMALINYLEMKASLQDDRTLNQLLDYLEPADIEAVGGYVLGNWPLQDLKQSQRKKFILEAIGQLTLPELIVATKEESPWSYAKLLLDQYGSVNYNIDIRELFELGNLFQFIPASEIVKINAASFRLFLESVGDSRSKTVCADSATRSAWHQLILKSFGEPVNWTAGVLQTLGDMLIVVPHASLLSVPEDSWKEAADVLINKTSYHLKLEWPGSTEFVGFYEACAELLSTSESPHYVNAVRELERWYLSAVQEQLNSVLNASVLLKFTHQTMNNRSEKKLIKDIPLEVVHAQDIVSILDTDTVNVNKSQIEKPNTQSNLNEDDKIDA